MIGDDRSTIHSRYLSVIAFACAVIKCGAPLKELAEKGK